MDDIPKAMSSLLHTNQYFHNLINKMPSLKAKTPLLPGKYYHLFNRGINSSKIFFREENYNYFLKQFNKYLFECDILAYCLMFNHFHFLIQIPEQITITDDSDSSKTITNENDINKYISNQLRRFFVSYSQAINKQEHRTGSLFERPFKRIMVEKEEYIKYLIFYIHHNPSKHIELDYKNYPNSSYTFYTKQQGGIINMKHGLIFFEDLDAFINYHSCNHEEKQSLLLEI